MVGGAQTDMDEQRLITLTQAADTLSMSPSFLRKLIARRQLDAVRIGRALRVKASDVARIAQDGLAAPRR
jgi:excisionase family DNA binding protein